MSVAGQGGGAAAYQQLQRLPNDLGQAMEGIASRQQADKRAINKVNEDRRIAKAKAGADFKAGTEIDPKDFEVKATNWQDADEIFGAASQSAMDTSIDLYAQARKAWDRGEENEARTLQQRAKRIETSFSNFASKREEFAEQINNTRELIKGGKILTESEGQFIDGLDRNEYTVDYKDGDFILSVMLRDKNGKIVRDEDGNAEYMQRSMNDVRKGLHRPFEFEEALGKDGMVDGLMVNFGLSKYDKEQDDYIITEQKWDNGNEALLENYVEGVIGGEDQEPDNREMYKWFKNATGEEKFKDWTDEDKQKVEDYIREGVASQFSEEVAMKIRSMKPSERLADNEANRQSREREGAANRKSREGIAKDRLDNDKAKWEAKVAADLKKAEQKGKLKAMGKNPEKKVKVAKFYQYAKDLKELQAEAKRTGQDFNEDNIREYFSKLPTPFKTSGNFDWFGLGGDEYDMEGAKSTAGLEADNIFRNVKAMARAAGVDLEDTDIQEVINNPEKYSVDSTNTAEGGTPNDPLDLGI